MLPKGRCQNTAKLAPHPPIPSPLPHTVLSPQWLWLWQWGGQGSSGSAHITGTMVTSLLLLGSQQLIFCCQKWYLDGYSMHDGSKKRRWHLQQQETSGCCCCSCPGLSSGKLCLCPDSLSDSSSSSLSK